MGSPSMNLNNAKHTTVITTANISDSAKRDSLLANAEINIATGEREASIQRSEGQKQAQINIAQGEAGAVLAIAEATASAIRQVAASIENPGGMAAVNLKVAEKYVDAFGNLAKTNNTLIVPANLSDVSSLIASAMQVVKTQQK